MRKIKHASLFSGIGGPEVAAAILGWDNVFHCEINPFGRRVLDYWFPNSESYEDITKTEFTKWRGRVDVLTGGFPCQPFSYAGKRGGAEDDRYLWPQMLRVIGEVRPAWVVGDNVAGITTMVEQGGGQLLKWKAKPLFSERVTEFTDTNTGNPSLLNGSAVTLKVSDIPSSRCLFQLALSVPRTDGTECSLLQTPTSVMTDETPEKMRARAERNGYKNGTKYGSLESQIKYDPKFADLLPTPATSYLDNELNNEKFANRNKKNLEEEVAKMVVTSQLARDGAGFRLSPLFTEEMMGFPSMWTAFPFLSDGGETKA